MGIIRKLRTLSKRWHTSPTTWPALKLVQLLLTTIFLYYYGSLPQQKVEQFIPKKILNSIAVKTNDIWCAKSRVLLQNANLKRDTINPVIRFNRSPLTIALVKHSHNLYDRHFINRTSACSHVGWKKNQCIFLKFGTIFQGSLLFKEVERACLECEQKRSRKYNVHMGLA